MRVHANLNERTARRSFAEPRHRVRLEDSKTGPRTVWLGPEAAKLVAALPRRDGTARAARRTPRVERGVLRS